MTEVLDRRGTARPVVVARTRAELSAARAQLPGPVGVVPTMGADTCGFESTHAIAICAMLTPFFFASSSTLVNSSA